MPTKKEKATPSLPGVASNWLSNWPIRFEHAHGVERNVWCCWCNAQAKRIHQIWPHAKTFGIQWCICSTCSGGDDEVTAIAMRLQIGFGGSSGIGLEAHEVKLMKSLMVAEYWWPEQKLNMSPINASDKPWIATGAKGVVWRFLRESVCCLMRLNPNR